MSLLSKSEVQFLQGQKQISKSYEYKLKSIIKKKLAILMEKELPLLSPLFPNLDLTNIGKIVRIDKDQSILTKYSKISADKNHVDFPTNTHNNAKFTTLNHDKLYICSFSIRHKRVRSVVRISRRSSEPQAMGSKPTGPALFGL